MMKVILRRTVNRLEQGISIAATDKNIAHMVDIRISTFLGIDLNGDGKILHVILSGKGRDGVDYSSLVTVSELSKDYSLDDAVKNAQWRIAFGANVPDRLKNG